MVLLKLIHCHKFNPTVRGLLFHHVSNCLTSLTGPAAQNVKNKFAKFTQVNICQNRQKAAMSCTCARSDLSDRLQERLCRLGHFHISLMGVCRFGLVRALLSNILSCDYVSAIRLRKKIRSQTKVTFQQDHSSGEPYNLL